MGSTSFLWNCTKKFVTAAVITVTVTDRFGTVVPVRGGSMSPTLNPKSGSLMGIFLAEGVHKKILLLQFQILLLDH